jgi:CRISPR/Cas system CSM-associated protein Csm5 (group 7 of RAMP superfamily)
MPRTLYLHTYSPIHIGSGVEIQPGEYALVGGEYYRIDPERLFGAIFDQHPDAHQQVVDWIEEQTEGLQTVDNRRASRQRQETNLFSFVERALRDAPLAAACRRISVSIAGMP